MLLKREFSCSGRSRKLEIIRARDPPKYIHAYVFTGGVMVTGVLHGGDGNN
jgi:hypothetical protein